MKTVIGRMLRGSGARALLSAALVVGTALVIDGAVSSAEACGANECSYGTGCYSSGAHRCPGGQRCICQSGDCSWIDDPCEGD